MQKAGKDTIAKSIRERSLPDAQQQPKSRMENLKDVVRLLAAILIFLTASAIVFMVIHSVSHVVGGFSLFAIAVIVVVAFFFIIMLCTYQCGDKTINRLFDRTRVDGQDFTGVAVISVPCRFGRTVSTGSETPSEITRRVYSQPWRTDNDDADLPPYIDEPPPDYFTATGKCPDSISCKDVTPPSPPTFSSDCNTGSEESNTCCSRESSNAATEERPNLTIGASDHTPQHTKETNDNREVGQQ